MLREEFRRWTERGCRVYGNDPWYFLRELAQNSRDAGAGIIRVRAYVNERNREVLELEDNGSGMTLEHARRYLYRLCAMSKEVFKSHGRLQDSWYISAGWPRDS